MADLTESMMLYKFAVLIPLILYCIPHLISSLQLVPAFDQTQMTKESTYRGTSCIYSSYSFLLYGNKTFPRHKPSHAYLRARVGQT